MTFGVADDLGGGVEPHRLRVEERRAEDVGVMALDPGGGVDEEGEARRMAFGKAVFAKTLDLMEAVLGELAIVAARHHAFDHLGLERTDGADPLEGRHGAAELVGLGGGEFRRHHGDLHRLLLEERHAESPHEHVLQFVLVAMLRRRRGIDHRLDALPAAEIGMDHVALDRAGPHDRHLDDEVVELLRLQARQHGHLRPALDLEDAERIGALQHAVDGRILGREGGEGAPVAIVLRP